MAAGSHPCIAAKRALELKGIAYDETELPLGAHFMIQRVRFGVKTIPTMRADGGEKVIGSTGIMRWADRQVPDPPLFPDPDVERAEAWGNDVLQPLARRLAFWALRHRLDAMPSYLVDSKLPVPKGLIPAVGRVVAPIEWRLHSISDEAMRADLEALPGHLAHVAELVERGVIGGDTPNAADFQIGSSLGLLRTIEDVRPLVDAGPAGDVARRAIGHYPGHIPAGVLPVAVS